MSENGGKIDVFTMKAVCDKETKSTYRFIVAENDFGISGSLYVNKSVVAKAPKTIGVKVRIKQGD